MEYSLRNLFKKYYGVKHPDIKTFMYNGIKYIYWIKAPIAT